MKTIEDKINEIVEGHAECRWLDACELRKYLEEVATEQKAIDDDHLREVKKMVVDKACEWLSKQGYDWWEGYGLPFTIEDFRKAMEE